MKKYKVKYARASEPNTIIFGLWDDSMSWAKWAIKQNREGDHIEFLMSYEEKTERKATPVLKKFTCPQEGSAYLPEYQLNSKEDEDES